MITSTRNRHQLETQLRLLPLMRLLYYITGKNWISCKTANRLDVHVYSVEFMAI